MLYACDAWHYLFESSQPETQCPDCGKIAVREATPDEAEEYQKQLSENMDL